MALCDKSGDAGFEGLVARHPKLPLTPTVPESAHLAVTEVHELDWLKYAIIFLIASLPLLRRTPQSGCKTDEQATKAIVVFEIEEHGPTVAFSPWAKTEVSKNEQGGGYLPGLREVIVRTIHA
ncbi:MAG: hypothetical protein ALECFALPRED_008453 [Alectoria fallacina]|uniref:Uncharacterized protein n=1 Tax=Alectoria fallacina TaxID=1903189 RepID=A0A8H3I2X0_9LECA|nr:MAG: hypothetical protein ALECFALPRED_008453 [Alectoria fallacina]